MIVLSYALALTAAALALHILIWRVALPQRQSRALLFIFLGVLAVGLFGGLTGLFPPLTLIQAAHVALTQIAGALAYICLYSAIEADSPTVQIVQFTAAAGHHGRHRDEYTAIINDDLLLGSRFRAMIRDGFVQEQAGTYRLTAKGVRMAQCFALTSRLFGMSQAG
jgi:hypothetical protein